MSYEHISQNKFFIPLFCEPVAMDIKILGTHTTNNIFSLKLKSLSETFIIFLQSRLHMC